MKPSSKDALRVGIVLALALLVVSFLGMARASFALTDTIWFASSGIVENQEKLTTTFSAGRIMLRGQAAFKMGNFLGAELGARYAQGPIQFRARSSFNKKGFAKAVGTATLEISGLSLTGFTNVGVKRAARSVLNATVTGGAFVVHGVALFQAATVTGLFSTVSYVKTFDCGSLSSTTRFSGRNFTEERFVLTASKDGLELGHTWVFTPNGWVGGLITANQNLGVTHLIGTVSWGLKGVEEGKLSFRTLIHEFRVRSTLRFNSAQVTSWSSLAWIKKGHIEWQGILLATQNGAQGRIAVSTSLSHVWFGSTLEFTQVGLQKVILEAAMAVGVIKVQSGLTFGRKGLSAELQVEGRWNVGS